MCVPCSELDSINHWFDYGNRCTKIAGYAQLSQTLSKPPAAIRDFVMRKVIENIGSIAYFQPLPRKRSWQAS